MRQIASSLISTGARVAGLRSFCHQNVLQRTLPCAVSECASLVSRKRPSIVSSRNSVLIETNLTSRLFHTTNLIFSQDTDLIAGEPDKLYSLIEVECRGHEPAVLRSYQTFVSSSAAHLNISLEEILWPKKHIRRWTLLKSVHIHKKHRVQYEVRTHFLIMKFARLTGSTADTFLEYIQRNLPEGVSMKVTKHELQKLPEHVKPSPEVII